MGGRPQKREKASGRKEWELGSTWNLKWTHVGTGLRCLRWDVVLVFRCPRFTLGRWYRFYIVLVYVGTGLRWDVVLVLRWYGFTVEDGDGVTLRGC